MSTRVQIVAVALLVGGLVLVAVLSFLGAASVRSEIADLREGQRAQTEALAAEIEATQDIRVEVPEEALSVTVKTDELLTIDAEPLVSPLIEADERNRQALISLAEILVLMTGELSTIVDNTSNQNVMLSQRTPSTRWCDDARRALNSIAEDFYIFANRLDSVAEISLAAMYVDRISTLQLLTAAWNCPTQAFHNPLVGFFGG